jgi:hypothetical protein
VATINAFLCASTRPLAAQQSIGAVVQRGHPHAGAACRRPLLRRSGGHERRGVGSSATRRCVCRRCCTHPSHDSLLLLPGCCCRRRRISYTTPNSREYICSQSEGWVLGAGFKGYSWAKVSTFCFPGSTGPAVRNEQLFTKEQIVRPQHSRHHPCTIGCAHDDGVRMGRSCTSSLTSS